MKTPEEMGQKYRDWLAQSGGGVNAFDAFMAGYEAAKDMYKDAIETYENVAKQMLQEAVRIMSLKDPLADASKVMCKTTMEQIKTVDNDELMPITNLLTPAKWISVKDRLPEIGHRILVTHRRSEDYANLHVLEARRISDDEYCLPEDYSILAHYVDYWMPLPEPPLEK